MLFDKIPDVWFSEALIIVGRRLDLAK